MTEQTDAPLQPDQKDNRADPSDNLTPEHPRFKEVIQEKNELKQQVKELTDQMQELRDSIAERQEETGDDDIDAEQQAALERIDKELREKKGYLTRADYEAEQRINRTAQQLDKLTDKYDGKNGYPKFVAEDVVAHAKKYGLSDMDKAYRDLHFDAIVQVEAKRANTPKVPSSERPTTGDREVPGTELTPDQIAQMDDNEYEKNREKILAGIKASTR